MYYGFTYGTFNAAVLGNPVDESSHFLLRDKYIIGIEAVQATRESPVDRYCVSQYPRESPVDR